MLNLAVLCSGVFCDSVHFSGIFHHAVHVLFCTMGGESTRNKQYRKEFNFLQYQKKFLRSKRGKYHMNIEKELCLNNFKNIELFSLVEPESWSPISLEFLQVNFKKIYF